MNYISAILRIICGMVLIILSYSKYQKIGRQVADGGRMRIFGFTTGASSGELALAFGVVGLIGVVLVILGIITLVRKRK